MSKNTVLEQKIRKVLKNYINEEIGMETKEEKQRCLTTNTIPLDEIIGGHHDYGTYVGNLNKRNGGISGMIDTLDRKSTRLNSSHIPLSRMPSSA